jgi:glycerophosphoryl diester phosphodiesterase
MLNEAYLRWAKRCGYRLNVWLPDKADEMRRLIAQGVDMIITDRPDVLAAALTGQ